MLTFFGAFVESFFYLWGNFLSNFLSLEALWGRYGLIFEVRRLLGAPNMPQDCAKMRFPRFGVTFLESFWDYFFVFFCIFA